MPRATSKRSRSCSRRRRERQGCHGSAMSEFSINLPPRLPAAGPAPNILTAVVPDAPRQLAQLDNGTIIKGVVQGRDPDGLLVIVTDKGALKLSTPANLPTGSQVT